MVLPHRAAVRPAVAEQQRTCSDPAPGDWAGDSRSFGIPGGLMLIAALLEPLPRAVIWTALLLWMGGVCLANARRCGRIHCVSQDRSSF